jgi:hypothetical protein
VEVQASWDDSTYEEYVAVTQQHFEPLLRAYNAAYSSKSRLSIQPKQDAEPKLPPKAKELFDQFAVLANKDMLHPLDWRRFYQFVWFFHARRVVISETDVEWLLIQAGFAKEQANDLADIYRHCRGVLAV